MPATPEDTGRNCRGHSREDGHPQHLSSRVRQLSRALGIQRLQLLVLFVVFVVTSAAHQSHIKPGFLPYAHSHCLQFSRLYTLDGNFVSSPSWSLISKNLRTEERRRTGGRMHMISNIFRWRDHENDDGVLVNIETPSTNVRRISASIVINRPILDIWRILTDYNRLNEYVPNLVQSKVIPVPPGEKARGVRLFQEGAQTIIGFNFKASLVMDMEEVVEADGEELGVRRIKFRLVDSAMFREFSGEWRIQCYGRMRSPCPDSEWTYSSKLFYMVTVKPKGPVPVAALEWRIKEDVPVNLRAVKVATENLPWDCNSLRNEGMDAEQQRNKAQQRQWMADETLGAYIESRKAVPETEDEEVKEEIPAR